jgi:hypothetical protein
VNPGAILSKASRHFRRTSGNLITIAALGSWSTAGIGASSAATTYPNRLMVELAQRLPTQPITVLNRVISGERAIDMLARFDESVAVEHQTWCSGKWVPTPYSEAMNIRNPIC